MLSPFEPHKYVAYHTPFIWRGGLDATSSIDQRLLTQQAIEMNAHPPCRRCSGSQHNPRLHPDG